MEKIAGAFSVPSEVLTYMCTGRPILGPISSVNLAARLIRDNCAGIEVEPEDEEGFVAAAHKLVADNKLRAQMGRAARAYAECAFAIARICDRFEAIFAGLCR